LNGKRFLVDPVFSGSASPISFTTKSFPGTDLYQAEDFPEIDYLLISHDHYDHLDYKTILELKPKIKQVICGLGVGSHFEYWGFEPNLINEKDWNEQIDLGSGLALHTATARHFSGRSFTRNNTLWMSYLLDAGDFKVYIGGDSGYDAHFEAIGEKFGGVDLAILDNGQYNLGWKEIHMLPEEVLKASKDLGAKRLFPVHSSKFVLANHPWDEPLIKVTEFNEENFVCPLVTPIIGELVYLKDSTQRFNPWWKEIR
jgi:L-ascorbate metabolism protein UlaG (beta-lactamase superfamily)